MAAPIRPAVWPPAPTPAPGRTDARLTAQKAFFQAALAGKPVEAPEIQRARPTAPTRTAASTAPATPDHIPPPGSIIDILV